jgi:sporulation protein YlmC with PRC-barrel domain
MRSMTSIAALTVALLAGSPAWAASESEDQAGTTGLMTTTPDDHEDASRTSADTLKEPGISDMWSQEMSEDSPMRGMRSNEIVGKTLYGSQGEEIGEISNVVMKTGGTTPEAVVGVGGFLGMGEQTITIPLSQIDMQGDRLVTNVTREQIEARGKYDETGYQSWGERTFGGAD